MATWNNQLIGQIIHYLFSKCFLLLLVSSLLILIQFYKFVKLADDVFRLPRTTLFIRVWIILPSKFTDLSNHPFEALNVSFLVIYFSLQFFNSFFLCYKFFLLVIDFIDNFFVFGCFLIKLLLGNKTSLVCLLQLFKLSELI